MAESKVVSIRVPQDLLEAIDQLAAERYPSRRTGSDPNRSQLILDALEAYVKHPDDTVSNFHTVHTVLAPEVIDARVNVLVDERLVPIQEKVAALEVALGEPVA